MSQQDDDLIRIDELTISIKGLRVRDYLNRRTRSRLAEVKVAIFQDVVRLARNLFVSLAGPAAPPSAAPSAAATGNDGGAA